MSEEGTGFIDIAPGVLGSILTLMPSAFRVVGSMQAEGHVRLVVASVELHGHGHHLTGEVRDVGCTRTMTLRPA